MTPQRVSIIMLGCSDRARARAFYKALGRQEAPLSLSIGAVTLPEAP